jgi:hypothetical protein
VLTGTVLALAAVAQDSTSAPPREPGAAEKSSAQQLGQQSDTPEKKDQAENPAVPSAQEVNPDPPHPPVAPASPIFRLAGSGLLQGSGSPIRLGPLYLSSAEIFGAYNKFSPSNGAADISQTGYFARANITLDEIYRSSRFAVQWEPRLFSVEGNTRGDVDNGSATMETTWNVSNRSSLKLSDNFNYFASRLLYGDFFASSGIVETPSSQQNSFLDASGHAVNNNAAVTYSYQLSPLTQIFLTPAFNYFHTTTSTSLLNSSREYRGDATLTRTISLKTNVGLHYSASSVEFKNTTNSVIYHSFGGTFAHLFSPSLSMTGSVGAATYMVFGNSRNWTVAGGASLTKNLKNKSLSLGFTRGLYLVDYITTSFTDRLDSYFSQSLTGRLTVELGGGLQKESRTNGYFGRYAQSSIGFRLFPMVGAYVRYTYSHQRGDQLFLTTGDRNLVVFGLRWQAPPRPSR